MNKSLLILFLFFIIFSCKNESKSIYDSSEKVTELPLTEIKDSIIRNYIEKTTKSLLDPKISLCKDCNPKVFRNDTLGGITKFNKKMIYYNKLLRVSNYSIESYRIDFKEKNYKNKIKDEKRIIFHWKFNNSESRKQFINHIEYYNRVLGKYKEESKVIIYQNEIIQNQDYRL
ncbi:MAG: hypothetical protein ACI87N_002049 [Flavobacteriales bacterium]|jgi:hypothetical protein